MNAALLHAIHSGHSVVISGQAGTGKSHLLNTISKELTAAGKTVNVTATTGIASTLLHGATTLHSCFGLFDGRYQTNALVARILNDDNYHSIRHRIMNMDVLIVDEVSMLSCQIFEQIEEICRKVRTNEEIFGGLQVILCGDMFQLKPVPTYKYGDNGQPILCSNIFTEAFQHRFHLTERHRQKDETLIKAVHEVARGEVSHDTEAFLLRLKRPLPPGDAPAKLFALNYDVELYNSSVLMSMDGEVKSYTALDSGDVKVLARHSTPKVLHLKNGVQVMLQVNLADGLVNGLCGTVTQLNDASVDVHFPSLNSTKTIKSYSFSVFDRERNVNIATRAQIPLKLAYALTVHKAQGLTLSRVEVDCRHMSNPGQIGVAIGRATESKGLRVLNFKKDLVRPHQQEIYDYHIDQSNIFHDDLTCCRVNISVKSNVHEGTPEGRSIDTFDDECESDELDELFEDWDEQVTETLTHTGVQYPLPSDINIKNLIDSKKIQHTITDKQTQLNSIIEGIKSKPQDAKAFAENIWSTLYTFYTETVLKENKDAKNRDFSSLYKKITLFRSSSKYVNLVSVLFPSVPLSDLHYRIAFGIVNQINSILLSKATEPIYVVAKEKAQAGPSSASSESKGSRAKVRYIGGWCIAKLRYSKRNFVKRNLYKKSTSSKITQIDFEIRMLDQLTAKEDVLTETSSDADSLSEVKRKQNISSGLTNISDQAFNFFIHIDTRIKELETFQNLNIYGPCFYKFIYNEMMNTKNLFLEWNTLFTDEDDITLETSTLSDLFKEVLSKYLKMSSAQFRKDYKRQLNVQKKESHRTQIRISGEKATSSSEGVGKPVAKKSRRQIVTVKYPCGVCKSSCSDECVCCDSCDIWFHFKCIRATSNEFDGDWYCANCK